VPPSGTTCLSTSHLRRHSRFLDDDSRPFCFPVSTKTLSYDSYVTIYMHHYFMDTCGLCNNEHYLGRVRNVYNDNVDACCSEHSRAVSRAVCVVGVLRSDVSGANLLERMSRPDRLSSCRKCDAAETGDRSKVARETTFGRRTVRECGVGRVVIFNAAEWVSIWFLMRFWTRICDTHAYNLRPDSTRQSCYQGFKSNQNCKCITKAKTLTNELANFVFACHK